MDNETTWYEVEIYSLSEHVDWPLWQKRLAECGISIIAEDEEQGGELSGYEQAFHIVQLSRPLTQEEFEEMDRWSQNLERIFDH